MLLTHSFKEGNSFIPRFPATSLKARKEITNALNAGSTLSNIDFMTEMNVAEFCSENEDACSIDDTAALINLFQDQVDIMQSRVKKIDTLLSALGTANVEEDRDVEKIREHIYEISSHVKTVSELNLCEMN